jgi:hypothetical protein
LLTAPTMAQSRDRYLIFFNEKKASHEIFSSHREIKSSTTEPQVCSVKSSTAVSRDHSAHSNI